MTTPITVFPRNDNVEAMQFDGAYTTAHDLARWLMKATEGTRSAQHLAMNYSSGLGQGNEFNFHLNGDTYEMHAGDWIIKDGELFSMVRAADFPLRYVSAVEKIKLEAGMD